jgi:serine/threonine protein phosphatase 1
MTGNFTYAIGDIHGCLRQLNEILARIEAGNPSGTVIFLGDYVDRGPDSKGVIDRIKAGPTNDGWTWVVLKGNHEDMMSSTLRSGRDIPWWLGNGGKETLLSYGGAVPGNILDWADALPMIHTDRHRIFVHAGVNEEIGLDNQTENDLLWSRKPSDYSGQYWGKHLCHGHTPARDNPRTVGNRTNVDSGCVFWGKLTCAVFDDSKPGGPIEFIHSETGTS